MRQVCNVSFAAQLEPLLEEKERVEFFDQLFVPPGGRLAQRSYVAPELDAMMAPASMRRGR